MDKGAFLLIFVGGGIGSCLRFWVSQTIYRELQPNFPAGTFVVNIIGCFLIGLAAGLVEKHHSSPQVGLLFVTGFCGGFTTFSTFIYENNLLVRDNQTFLALTYTLLSGVFGFTATYWAIALGRQL